MKKIVVVMTAIALTFSVNAAFGQEENKREKLSPIEKAEKHTEKMKEELSLTDEQAEEIKQMNLYHIQEMEELKMQMKKLKEEARAKREAHQLELEKVLDDEQKQIMNEKIAERKKKRAECKKNCHERPPHED